jgi:hypothetical protein
MDADDRSNLSPRLTLWQMWEAQLEHTEDPLREGEEERELHDYVCY